MNRIGINEEGIPAPVWKKEAKSYILKVLDILGKKNWDLSALFCDDVTIRRLNREYRRRDEATDVLSFAPEGLFAGPPTGRGRHFAGDIAISLDTLAQNARVFKVPCDEELRRLLIHGILHLDGRDHKTNGKGEPMLELQEEILALLAAERIIDPDPETEEGGG